MLSAVRVRHLTLVIAPAASCTGLSCSTHEQWAAGSVGAGAGARVQVQAGQHHSRLLLVPLLPLALEEPRSPALVPHHQPWGKVAGIAWSWAFWSGEESWEAAGKCPI